MVVDALDLGILRLLREDARRSMRQLARELGSTAPTVAARVRTLEAEGHLLGYHAHVADALLGGRTVWVLARCRPAAARDEAALVAQQAWANEVHELVGGLLLVRARLEDGGLRDVQGWMASRDAVLSYDVHESLGAQRTGLPAIRMAKASGRCDQCGRPIEGAGVRASLGGRRHTFCCVVCRDTFQARFQKAVAALDGAPRASRSR